MHAKLIKTEAEHVAALSHVESLMDAEPGSPEEEELELWSLLIEQYEKEHFPMADPDPIEAIRFRMDQLGLKPKDLQEYIGTKSKVSKVLNRKRQLSLPMIRSLHTRLGIPAETLVRASQPLVVKRVVAARQKAKKDSRKSGAVVWPTHSPENVVRKLPAHA